jgi:hypothetical protein
MWTILAAACPRGVPDQPQRYRDSGEALGADAAVPFDIRRQRTGDAERIQRFSHQEQLITNRKQLVTVARVSLSRERQLRDISCLIMQMSRNARSSLWRSVALFGQALIPPSTNSVVAVT